jgi:hypothetical protein
MVSAENSPSLSFETVERMRNTAVKFIGSWPIRFTWGAAVTFVVSDFLIMKP